MRQGLVRWLAAALAPVVGSPCRGGGSQEWNGTLWHTLEGYGGALHTCAGDVEEWRGGDMLGTNGLRSAEAPLNMTVPGLRGSCLRRNDGVR